MQVPSTSVQADRGNVPAALAVHLTAPVGRLPMTVTRQVVARGAWNGDWLLRRTLDGWHDTVMPRGPCPGRTAWTVTGLESTVVGGPSSELSVTLSTKIHVPGRSRTPVETGLFVSWVHLNAVPSWLKLVALGGSLNHAQVYGGVPPANEESSPSLADWPMVTAPGTTNAVGDSRGVKNVSPVPEPGAWPPPAAVPPPETL
jgi:hypothetical protein